MLFRAGMHEFFQVCMRHFRIVGTNRVTVNKFRPYWRLTYIIATAIWCPGFVHPCRKSRGLPWKSSGCEWSVLRPCHFTPEETPVPLVQEAGLATEPFWTNALEKRKTHGFYKRRGISLLAERMSRSQEWIYCVALLDCRFRLNAVCFLWTAFVILYAYRKIRLALHRLLLITCSIEVFYYKCI